MKRYKPLILTAIILLCDQLSKAWVVAHIPENTIGYKLFGDFLEIWHVRNTAIAFSLGTNLPLVVKLLGFIFLPLVLLVVVVWAMFSPKQPVSEKQRWILALFLGGGMGNLADRIFRHFRVVDFMNWFRDFSASCRKAERCSSSVERALFAFSAASWAV